MDSRCQQFTPRNIAEDMLNIIKYTDNLFGKKVLENSCGQGNILKIIIERYILDGKKRGYSNIKIKHGLEKDIYGVEIEEKIYIDCIKNIDRVAKRYGITNVKWKVFNRDILKERIDISFDYVIGNPPYISYKYLDINQRKFIKENFETCKNGKPDYCYAFIENAISYLKDGGKMIYLIPNSIFKNIFAKQLRKTIMKHLINIFDYPNQKLFQNALTSSALILLVKNSNEQIFQYNNVSKNINFNIDKKTLTDKWIFKDVNNFNNVNELVRFGDFFKAAITIVTQRNKVFVVNLQTKLKFCLENELLKRAISPRNKNYKNKEYIIFPYKFNKDYIEKFKEEEFREKYPNAYKYLKENREELSKRNADKNAQWFEYGRSQAIHNMNQKKVLISTVVTNEVKAYMLGVEEIPYSGIYIIKTGNYDLNVAKNILESESFFNYVQQIGTPASGNSLRITADDINNFRFNREEFDL